jgi:hypothetical protein
LLDCPNFSEKNRLQDLGQWKRDKLLIFNLYKQNRDFPLCPIVAPECPTIAPDLPGLG